MTRKKKKSKQRNFRMIDTRVRKQIDVIPIALLQVNPEEILIGEEELNVCDKKDVRETYCSKLYRPTRNPSFNINR